MLDESTLERLTILETLCGEPYVVKGDDSELHLRRAKLFVPPSSVSCFATDTNYRSSTTSSPSF